MIEDDLAAYSNMENIQEIAHHVTEILKLIGEDPNRPGLLNTPMRAAMGLTFFTKGFHQDEKVEEILTTSVFTNNYSEMVLVKDIDFYSLCEHHLLPIYGKVHIAYIPSGKVIGLSKIPRIVDIFARRLQIQEQMTIQIRDAIDKYLSPDGTAVLIEANHLCMMSRGIQKIHSKTITSALSGKFLENQATREEFMSLIK